jgi:hypothetical protein
MIGDPGGGSGRPGGGEYLQRCVMPITPGRQKFREVAGGAVSCRRSSGLQAGCRSGKQGRYMRKIGWLLGVGLLIATGAPALAQDLAAQIKQDVEDALAPLVGTEGDSALTHGGVDVFANGGAYVVTISDLRGVPDNTGYLAIGTVSFRMTPEGDDLYRIDEVKIPQEIPHKAADGSVDGSIALPSQQFTGTWSRSLENFVQLDAAYRDIRVTSTAENLSITLGEVTTTLVSTDKGNGRFDQNATFRLGNFNVSDPDGMFSLGTVDVTSNALDYNARGWAAVQNQIEAMTANVDPNAPPAAVDPQLFEALRGVAPLISGGVTNVKVSAISYRETTGAEMFSLPEGAFSMTLEGFDQAIGRIMLTLGHRGLVVSGADPPTKDLVPHELAINVALENLPVQEIWNGAIDTFASADMSTDEGSSMAMFMMMGLLQQSLVNGKSRMDMTDWRIVNALAQAQLDGVIEASAESMFGAVGKVKLDVTGLDKLIESVRTNFGPEADEMAMLEVLRGFSTRQTAADGTIVDHYDIDFTPAGQLLVNGKEYSFMGPTGGEMPPEGSTMEEGSRAPEATAPPPTEGSGETTTGN